MDALRFCSLSMRDQGPIHYPQHPLITPSLPHPGVQQAHSGMLSNTTLLNRRWRTYFWMVRVETCMPFSVPISEVATTGHYLDTGHNSTYPLLFG
jgi:hypothetical protein